MDFSDFSITVVGLGLIGGSYAKALRQLNPKKLWAIDINGEVLKEAERLNVIDQGFLVPEYPLKHSDIVIMAIYPLKTISFIKDHMSLFKTGAVITDTAGIKKDILKEIIPILREDIDFIGGHPMAGKEISGFNAASQDLFKRASYIITPVARNNVKNVEKISALVREIGCENIVLLNPEEHDEIIAYTSQLPHVIAVSLMNSAENAIDVPKLVAGSFKDATRVASINDELWSELLMSNRENIIHTIEKFEENIKTLKDAIMKKDENYLISKFIDAKAKRKGIM